MTARCSVLTLLAIAAATFAAAPAVASTDGGAPQVALLVGVESYGGPNVDLRSPGRDVAGVRGALEEVGDFDTMVRLDPDRDALIAALFEARERAAGGVILFYFSGHAITLDGVNYLLPANTIVRTPGEVPLRGVSVQQVLGALDGARLRLLILDACRSNAFAVGGKAVGSSGLSRDILAGYEGTLVSYAAAPGSIAYDGGEGEMSPFTKALVNHLPTPGLDLLNLFTRVRGELRASTSHLPRGPQRSEEINSLVGDENFALVPRAATGGAKRAAGPAPPMAPAGIDNDEATSALPLLAFAGIGVGAGLAVVGAAAAAVGAGTAWWAESTLGDTSVPPDVRTLALSAGAPALVIAIGAGVVAVAGIAGAAAGGALLTVE